MDGWHEGGTGVGRAEDIRPTVLADHSRRCHCYAGGGHGGPLWDGCC